MKLAHVTAATVVAVAVAMITLRLKDSAHRRGRREGFPIIAPLVGLVTTVGLGAMKATGADKKLGGAIVGLFDKNAVANASSTAPAKYQVTYRGREWDGKDWSCPAGTIETGNSDDSKACITSQFHPPTWRNNGKEWSHSCPNLTVETGEQEWEKKCEVGWVHRQQIDGKWQCPPETEDSGKTWDNSPWKDAQKQCKVKGPYTRRTLGTDKKTWVCPEGTKDTGLTWTSPQNGGNQCKWIGG